MIALDIQNLHKTYRGSRPVDAVKGVSFQVTQGEFFGLLGPNGAGKSTIIGILSSLINKTSGRVLIHGVDLDRSPAEAKRYLGIVPQEFNFNIFDTCEHIVRIQAGYYGVPYREAKKRAAQLLDELGLGNKLHTKASQLSGGMKRRLMIARALVHRPRLLILDEPTAGVDIMLRRSMWEFLTQQNQAGLTIILTTHYLEEAESLCHRIAIMNQGLLIENTSTPQLLQKLHRETVVLYTSTLPDTIVLPALEHGVFKKMDESTLEVDIGQNLDLTDVISTLKAAGIVVHRMKNKANRLEELFISLTSGHPQ